MIFFVVMIMPAVSVRLDNVENDHAIRSRYEDVFKAGIGFWCLNL